jgi:predicted transcriptional regulator
MTQIDFSCRELKDLNEKAHRGERIAPEQVEWLKRVYYNRAGKSDHEEQRRREIAEAREYYKAHVAMSRSESALAMSGAGYKQTVIAEVIGVSKQAVNRLIVKAKNKELGRICKCWGESFSSFKDYLAAQKAGEQEMAEAARARTLFECAKLNADHGLGFHMDKTSKWPSEEEGQRLRAKYIWGL